MLANKKLECWGTQDPGKLQSRPFRRIGTYVAKSSISADRNALLGKGEGKDEVNI
jgi:hypothetical protein